MRRASLVNPVVSRHCVNVIPMPNTKVSINSIGISTAGRSRARPNRFSRASRADRVSRGAAFLSLDDKGDGRASSSVARAISHRLGMETRVTVLGHLQRGGIPTPQDRILATRLGTYAAEMLAEGVYNRMVALKGSEVTSVPLEEVAGKLKLVPPDHPLIFVDLIEEQPLTMDSWSMANEMDTSNEDAQNSYRAYRLAFQPWRL